MHKSPFMRLSFRFSGVCQNARVKGKTTAHYFASILMLNPGGLPEKNIVFCPGAEFFKPGESLKNQFLFRSLAGRINGT